MAVSVQSVNHNSRITLIRRSCTSLLTTDLPTRGTRSGTDHPFRGVSGQRRRGARRDHGRRGDGRLSIGLRSLDQGPAPFGRRTLGQLCLRGPRGTVSYSLRRGEHTRGGIATTEGRLLRESPPSSGQLRGATVAWGRFESGQRAASSARPSSAGQRRATMALRCSSRVEEVGIAALCILRPGAHARVADPAGVASAA